MVETPAAGFTGVVWEARPADQLARELTTGPGPVPLAEAGAGWTRLAASFGTAAAEYDRIIGEIGDHWRSEISESVLARSGRMQQWLTDAATSAGNNAQHAAGQAASYELARLAMPHVTEIAALQAAAQQVVQAGMMLGAPLVAAAAQLDAEQDLAKQAAARVMRTYESATDPLAQPWTQTPPPKLIPGATAPAGRAAASGVSAAMPGGANLSALGIPPGLSAIAEEPVPLGRAQVQTVDAADQQTESETAQQSEIPAQSMVDQAVPASGMPAGGMPGAMTPGAGSDVAQASAITGRVGDLGLDAGLASAPPVLGAADPGRATAAERAS